MKTPTENELNILVSSVGLKTQADLLGEKLLN